MTDDDGVRPDTTPESLAKLRGAFSPDGTITAGNSSQITDGAAALVLMSEETAAARGITPLARIETHAAVAGPDTRLHAQPANAILAALARIEAGSPRPILLPSRSTRRSRPSPCGRSSCSGSPARS